MSYCRFGPHSDLYIYEDFEGHVTIHVAGSRRVIPDDMPENPYAKLAQRDAGPSVDKKKFDRQVKTYRNALDRCVIEKISLTRDNASFRVDHAEAAGLVKSLQQEGYHVLPGVIDALLEDADTQDSQTT